MIIYSYGGELSYVQSTRELVGMGMWLSEPTLWTHWIHHGTLRALGVCQLLVLEAEILQSVIGPYPTNHARKYAVLFVEMLNQDLDKLTDLPLPDQAALIPAVFIDGDPAAQNNLGLSRQLKRTNSKINLKRSKSSKRISLKGTWLSP